MTKICKAILPATLLLAAAASLQAGETYVSSSKQVEQPVIEMEDCYPNHEWTIDLFGTYAFTESTNERILGDHAFGGGVAANYFFTRNWGVGLEGQYLDVKPDGIGSAAINVFYRYPIGCWAPYAYVGGGAIFNANNIDQDNFADEFDEDDRDSNDVFMEAHAGVGVEYRITKNFGVFTDARWTIVEQEKNNFPSVRTGVRFAF